MAGRRVGRVSVEKDFCASDQRIAQAGFAQPLRIGPVASSIRFGQFGDREDDGGEFLVYSLHAKPGCGPRALDHAGSRAIRLREADDLDPGGAR